MELDAERYTGQHVLRPTYNSESHRNEWFLSTNRVTLQAFYNDGMQKVATKSVHRFVLAYYSHDSSYSTTMYLRTVSGVYQNLTERSFCSGNHNFLKLLTPVGSWNTKSIVTDRCRTGYIFTRWCIARIPVASGETSCCEGRRLWWVLSGDMWRVTDERITVSCLVYETGSSSVKQN